MSRTGILRRQHEAAVEIVSEILSASDRMTTRDDAYQVILLLAKLTGLLRIHFAQEDRNLYPVMIATGNTISAQTARAFQEEMGGLAEAFEAYAARWFSATVIMAKAAAFRQESADVFGALARRIERENEELYPLAEALDPDSQRRAA